MCYLNKKSASMEFDGILYNSKNLHALKNSVGAITSSELENCDYF